MNKKLLKIELQILMTYIKNYTKGHDYYQRIRSFRYNNLYKQADKICQTLRQG